MNNFFTIDEVYGLHVDAMLVDDRDELVFLSLWGRDTAIREFEGKLTLTEREGGIRTLTLLGMGMADRSIRTGDVDTLEHVTGRMPKESLFGQLTNFWLYRDLVVTPDLANRRGVILFKGEREETTREQRLTQTWKVVKDTCALPLLDHWRDPILGMFREMGWITELPGTGVSGTLINLGDDELEQFVSRMIEVGDLTLKEGQKSTRPRQKPKLELVSSTPPPANSVTVDYNQVILKVAREHGIASMPMAACIAIWEDCLCDGDTEHYEQRLIAELLSEESGESGSDDTLEDIFGPVVSAYTRAQALEDGALVDVSKTAREAGFKWPVALTSACWEACVAWSDEDSMRQVPQDESGRVWDVLYMAMFAIKRSRNGGTTLQYELRVVPRGGRGKMPRRTFLKLVTGPGDNGEPVVTIMLPNED